MKLLTLTGVQKRFGEKDVLRGITLSVDKGRIIGIVGRSGAGKTTLLRIINLLEQPTAGSVTFTGGHQGNGHKGNGHKGNGMRRIDIQRRMAMVFQKPVLFDDSVLNNVCYGLRLRDVPAAQAKKRALAALAGFGLHDLHRNARRISGGEAQRVAFCQALIVRPDLLLLDEPTANLDAKNVQLLEKQVLGMRKQQHTAVIIASHDKKHVRTLCDEVYTLHEGRLRR